MSAGQAGRVGDHRQHAGAECAVGGPGEIGGIDAAGIGDQQSAELAEVCLAAEIALHSSAVSEAA